MPKPTVRAAEKRVVEPAMRDKLFAERSYKRCPDGDRKCAEPGGMECQTCGCIFIGAEWHSQCAVCVGERDYVASLQRAEEKAK